MQTRRRKPTELSSHPFNNQPQKVKLYCISGGAIPNPYSTWDEVNPDLPAINIEVMGPPLTSGTRDALAELVKEGGCKIFDWIADLAKTDKSAYKPLCHTLREDAAYIEAGKNDNLIVQKLVENPNALGNFGYSFWEQNADVVQGSGRKRLMGALVKAALFLSYLLAIAVRLVSLG